MGFNSAISSSAVKTAIDRVAYAVFDGPEAPNYAGADDPLLFNQESIDRAAAIMENFKGVPFWTTVEEEENLPEHSPRIGQQKTHSVLKYAASIDIPKNYFDRLSLGLCWA